MNLILVATPLQALIALRIFEQYPQEEFIACVYADKGGKLAYYTSRLSISCRRVYLVPTISREKLSVWSLIKLVCLSLYLRNATRIFIASTEKIAFQLLISRLSHSEIITYDDGSISLCPNAYAYLRQDIRYIGLLGFAQRVLKAPVSSRILDRSTEHLSIYPEGVTFTNRPQRLVSLMNNNLCMQSPDRDAYKVVKIFLGQPLYELYPNGAERSAKLTKQAICETESDLYFPHPRETYCVDDVKYIDSPMIFEEYLLKLLYCNSQTRYIVYSFCSSALLHVQGLPRVSVVAIYPKDCPQYCLEVYLALARSGIDIYQLEE